MSQGARVQYTKGKHLPLEFNLTNPDTGGPVDVSGWSGVAKIYSDFPVNGGTELASASIDLVDAPFGQFQFLFLDTDTTDLPDVAVVFWCDVTQPDGLEVRLLEGILVPEP